MHTSAFVGAIRCDGCGAIAHAEHLAERLHRLELATRYRPIHISVLFIALAPKAGQDFYDSPLADPGSRALLEALEISLPQEESSAEPSRVLGEFQRRGYYLSYISECPLAAETTAEQAAALCANLSPAVLLRIQRNYRPQKIALLGPGMHPVRARLEAVGLGPSLLNGGTPFELFGAQSAALERFRSALAKP